MSDITDSSLLVKSRDLHGSSKSRQLRAAGQIPTVFYGKDVLKHYTVEDAQFRTLMRSTGGSLSLIELDEGNGNKELALLKDMQKPIRLKIRFFTLILSKSPGVSLWKPKFHLNSSVNHQG